MNMEPTNADLKESFDRHSADDRLFQEAQGLVNEATAKSLESLHKQVGDIAQTQATKEDMEELKRFLKNANIGIGVLRFTFNNASKIGAFAFFLFACWIFLKLGVVGVVAWAKSIGAI